jgi:dihydroorotase
MIHITGVTCLDGQCKNYLLDSNEEYEIDARGLTLLPGLIDPHVHFRTPGMEYKEDWRSGALAAICGGYTTVFDMPNTLPPTITASLLQNKMNLIDAQLKEVNIPLRYQLFFGADKQHFSEIHRVKNVVVGIKVFMGCSTGNLVIDDDESLHAIFAIASSQNLLVAVHAEDEQRICSRKKSFQHAQDYHHHSLIRDVTVATLAVEKAIHLAKIYKTRLYILHVSTKDEIELIKKAKQSGLTVYAETTPHHLFLNDAAYQTLQGKAVVNPPLRNQSHQAELFQAIREGVIDTIGSDHAPHTLEEKAKKYGECPSGIPGIETMLPLLLTAVTQGLLSLDNVISLTVTKAQNIFKLEKNNDVVLVNLDKIEKVTSQNLQTKSAWTPYENWELCGWPYYTIVNGRCFDINAIKHNQK